VRLPSFRNEPRLELRRKGERSALLEALRALDARLPIEVPALIGEERTDGRGLSSTDPGEPDRLVAKAELAGTDLAGAAVERALVGFQRWSSLEAEARARALLGAAEVLRRRRLELAALEVREAAKPWPEADADVCEAIDYLEYYARGALALAEGRPLIQVPGERNLMHYAPRGVTAAITPWNFPLAIPCGITSAALATGNAVVLKPAEQTPATALALVEALREGGVPLDAIVLLPGAEEAGRTLVEHPDVPTIGFTGSEAAGLDIVRRAAQMKEDQQQVKRVVCEMGGKNAIVIDSDADLDEAVPAILHSAFDYGGQKCSAAARVLCSEAVAESLETRLRGAVELLRLGQAEGFATDVPPLIERPAQERVLGFADRAEREGRIVIRRDDLPERGWFVGPTVAADLPADSSVVSEEIFGPVLALAWVASVDEALADLKRRRHGLTCGLFSRSPTVVERFSSEAPAGNVYVNRKITGAVVGRQPFGGNRRSGIGYKAGGPDYLLQFVNTHVVSESTMRHGLVAE
jgi:RHH-type transcriptional regulator, proline utilization regulon repressor / proline dehydrogenase / delta 1-pyrroline-5-carboxylate dehydrogenase